MALKLGVVTYFHSEMLWEKAWELVQGCRECTDLQSRTVPGTWLHTEPHSHRHLAAGDSFLVRDPLGFDQSALQTRHSSFIYSFGERSSKDEYWPRLTRHFSAVHCREAREHDGPGGRQFPSLHQRQMGTTGSHICTRFGSANQNQILDSQEASTFLWRLEIPQIS